MTVVLALKCADGLVLAAGIPFIVDIDPRGLIGRHEEVGFQAIGSVRLAGD